MFSLLSRYAFAPIPAAAAALNPAAIGITLLELLVVDLLEIGALVLTLVIDFPSRISLIDVVPSNNDSSNGSKPSVVSET